MTDQLTNQSQEADPTLWERASQAGLSRRSFMRLLSLGGSAAVLMACAPQGASTKNEASEEPAKWAKDPAPFNELGGNLEAKLEDQMGLITPNERFFVRNHVPTPPVDMSSYRLKVEGDAVEKPLELSYDDLLRMPSQTVLSCVECAGNHRSLFEKVLGEPASGGQWTTGGVSMAEWTGVSLRTILEMAGVKPNAVDVNVKGLDTDASEGGFQRAMPLEKAMDPDTILAYAMNGVVLPPDHGYPIRALVPGWVGGNNIKWVGSLTVSTEKIWSKNNTTSYVMVGDEWPAEPPADGGPITTLNVRSSLALAWSANLSKGSQVIRGFARSPHGSIAKVEWSADGGNSWQAAALVGPNLKYAWTRFEFTWDAPAGDQTLMTRATDEAGNSQPDTVPFNAKGYLFNMAYPHPVKVA